MQGNIWRDGRVGAIRRVEQSMTIAGLWLVTLAHCDCRFRLESAIASGNGWYRD